MLRMHRGTVAIERPEPRRQEMIGAGKPVAGAHRDCAWAAFDDRGNAAGVEQRIVILHGVRKVTE